MSSPARRFLSKLSVINYKIATHEGDANRRLASQIDEIFLLSKSQVPIQYNDQFEKLIGHLEYTVEKLPGLMTPTRVKGIYNKSAVRFIILLIEIEDYLRSQLEN